jgi:hypothetical protein
MEITEESFKVTASSIGDYVTIESRQTGGGKIGIHKKNIDVLIKSLEKTKDFGSRT